MKSESLKQVDHAGQREQRAREFYERAKKRAEAFLPTIDKGLEVKIVPVSVTPHEHTQPKYESLALDFSHQQRPELHWTMEIEEEDAYLEHRFEDAVRRIYAERVDDPREKK